MSLICAAGTRVAKLCGQDQRCVSDKGCYIIRYSLLVDAMVNIMPFTFELLTPDATRKEIRLSARRLRLAHNMTQNELALKSGVALSTLKRFEQSGEVSLSALLAVAGALGALQAFSDLFPQPTATTLDQLDSDKAERKRARPRRS